MTGTSPKTIRDGIIAILETANPKNGLNKSIKKWFSAEPLRSNWPGFPFAWCEWTGGPLKPRLSSQSHVFDRFYIVVVDEHAKEEVAEDSILDFACAAKDALEADRTLDSLVAASWVSNREKQKLFEKDYSLVAVRLTLETRRTE